MPFVHTNCSHPMQLTTGFRSSVFSVHFTLIPRTVRLSWVYECITVRQLACNYGCESTAFRDFRHSLIVEKFFTGMNCPIALERAFRIFVCDCWPSCNLLTAVLYFRWVSSPHEKKIDADLTSLMLNL